VVCQIKHSICYWQYRYWYWKKLSLYCWGWQATAHSTKKTIGATISSYINIPTGDENSLKQAVATAGPISVDIDASQDSFQSYIGGVYNESNCSTSQFDSNVLVVGYNTTSDG